VRPFLHGFTPLFETILTASTTSTASRNRFIVWEKAYIGELL
jgi:hypothetical protein